MDITSKQQEDPPEPTRTKEEICLEQMKIKVKRSSLEWDNFVLQEHLKSLIYVDRSSSGDPNIDKLIDELNSKNCIRLKRNTTSKFFVGIKFKKRLLFILNILMPKISSHIHLFIISNINQTWFNTCQEK